MMLTPWKFFMVALAGWMNRRQQEAIEYFREENRTLRENLGHKRLILNESQKRRLSQAAAKLGRQLLREVGTLFSPDTLLKWNRWFIARKYDGSDRRGKRGPKPTKANMIRKLVLRMAAENPSWGYGRINGELKKLGYNVHWQTVRRVMLDHGLLPDPDKPYKTTWKTFIQSHWDSIAACDFFSAEAWGLKGLTRYTVFFVIDLATRRVQIAGIHADPCETQMLQWARNLTDAEDGSQGQADPDPRPRSAVHEEVPGDAQGRRRAVPQDAEVVAQLVSLQRGLGACHQGRVPQQDDSLRREARPIRGRAVRRASQQGTSAQGLGYCRPIEPDEAASREGEVRYRERLGGLLKSYYREAA